MTERLIPSFLSNESFSSRSEVTEPVNELTIDYFPFARIDYAFSIGFAFFFKRTENNIFYSLEKGTSISIVPKNPKNKLIAATLK